MYLFSTCIVYIIVYFGYVFWLPCLCLTSGSYINTINYEELVIIMNPFETNIPPFIVLKDKRLIPSYLKIDKKTNQTVSFDLIYPTIKLNYNINQFDNSFVQIDQEMNTSYLFSLKYPINDTRLELYWIDYHRYQQDARSWCDILQNTSEPDILVYNRVPKCGSSTIDYILRNIKLKYHEYVYYPTPRVYWNKDFDQDTTIKNDLSKEIINRLNNTSKLLLFGHFYHHKYDPKDFSTEKDINIQYMNLLRNCPERRKSLFLFHTFDLPDSQNAIAMHPNSTKEQIYKDNLHTSMNSEECIRSKECLLHYDSITHMFFKSCINYFCESKCIEIHGRPMKGALYNILNPNEYISVGVMEYFRPFMEMSECVFPTYFKDAANIYDKIGNKNIGSHSHMNLPELTSIVEETCMKNMADYNLYYALLPHFYARYQAMKQMKNCCRR